MERYESKQVVVNRPAEIIYRTLSDSSNFTPILQDKVDEWEADSDRCSFKVKGIRMELRIVEREENSLIKIEGEDGSPVDFKLWIQMKETAPQETRLRLVMDAKLNMMMKMMIGGKIKGALDQIADQIAYSFNNAPL